MIIKYTNPSSRISVFFLLLFIVIVFFTATRREILTHEMDEKYFQDANNMKTTI